MRALAIILAALAAGAGCGGSDPWGLDGSNPQPALIELPGDQLNPSLDGDALAWFDLAGDPNGACHTPAYDPDGEPDTTCQGVVRTLDLRSGRLRTVSPPADMELMPVVSGGWVAWHCRDARGQGVCASPVAERDVHYHPGIDQYSAAWHDSTVRLAAAGGRVFWAAYSPGPERYTYQLRHTDLADGSTEILAELQRFPSALAASAQRVAWVSQHWDGQRHILLESLDLRSGRQQTLVDSTDAGLFGLAAAGDTVAWKQSLYADGQLQIQVRYQRPGDPVQRADTPSARVSAETPLTAAPGRLAWLDHREGDYRVAVYDLDTETEHLITPEEAIVGAYATPTLTDDLLVHPDLRQGDWDLLLLPR